MRGCAWQWDCCGLSLQVGARGAVVGLQVGVRGGGAVPARRHLHQTHQACARAHITWLQARAHQHRPRPRPRPGRARAAGGEACARARIAWLQARARTVRMLSNFISKPYVMLSNFISKCSVLCPLIQKPLPPPSRTSTSCWWRARRPWSCAGCQQCPPPRPCTSRPTSACRTARAWPPTCCAPRSSTSRHRCVFTRVSALCFASRFG